MAGMLDDRASLRTALSTPLPQRAHAQRANGPSEIKHEPGLSEIKREPGLSEIKHELGLSEGSIDGGAVSQ